MTDRTTAVNGLGVALLERKARGNEKKLIEMRSKICELSENMYKASFADR